MVFLLVKIRISVVTFCGCFWKVEESKANGDIIVMTVRGVVVFVNSI